MSRLPYLPADLAEPKDLVNAIRTRRGGALLNLDRMLLHSPPLARGWNAFLREVRSSLSLPAKLRELAMCAVAVLNRADYEFHHHVPEFIRAGGTAAQVEALRDMQTSGDSLFDTTERAVLELATQMTRDVQVTPETFAAVKAALPEAQQVVELVGTIAAYNMVSRFLVALAIEPE
jgi:alkylhydroperoxidase family enzyme